LLARLAGRTLPMRPAVLAGWRRLRLGRSPYPTLARGRGRVHGAVIEAGPSTLRRLAAYEGARYRPVPVAVRAVRRRLRAYAWIAAGATTRPWP
jgi:gamma-glutamylcyclotransferase (GGCT)/AIG2-like uncharacterized protein YtfP